MFDHNVGRNRIASIALWLSISTQIHNPQHIILNQNTHHINEAQDLLHAASMLSFLSFCWNGSMQCTATQVTFMHIKTGAIVWQNLCWVDLLPPLLLLATSTPLGDIMAGDSRDRLGFKVTVAVEVAALALRRTMSRPGALLAIFNLVGEPTTDLDN